MEKQAQRERRHTEAAEQSLSLSYMRWVGLQADQRTLYTVRAKPEFPTGGLGHIWVPQWT